MLLYYYTRKYSTVYTYSEHDENDGNTAEYLDSCSDEELEEYVV